MALGMLYLKAAVSSVGPRARELPDTVLTRDGVEVDRAHLAEYARVCGFALTDALPVTYPHLLAFGLQVELMAGRSFPLPLPGLVHVANTITVHRRIDASERLDVRVHAERFVSHPKGAQVDLVGQISAGGQEVWSGRSTYLARGASAPDSAHAHPDGSHAQPDGDQAGPDGDQAGPDGDQAGPDGDRAGPDGDQVRPDARSSFGVDRDTPAETGSKSVWKVDAGTGRRYAAISGDVNPIHLHPLTAKAFGFPRAIAHGMWTAARAVAALEGRLPDAVTYDVAFGKPVLLPSTVELRTHAAGGDWRLEVRSGNRTHLTGSVRPIS
jgi:acyl dehydratase